MSRLPAVFASLLFAASVATVSCPIAEAAAPPTVKVVFPNGSESLSLGGDVQLVWHAEGSAPIASIRLDLSRDFGSSWVTIADPLPNTGSYVWRVTPPVTGEGSTEIFSALLRVTATDSAGVEGSDQSDDYFSIWEEILPTVITQLEGVSTESGIEIRWAFANRSAFVAVALERAESEPGPWLPLSAALREENGSTVATDATATAGASYFYRLIGTTASGAGSVFGPVKVTSSAPGEFAVERLWPNPSRGPISMVLATPASAHVKLSLIDLMGREVAVLANGPFAAGRFRVDWDGRTERGRVPEGVYFVRLQMPERTIVRRIAIAR